MDPRVPDAQPQPRARIESIFKAVYERSPRLGGIIDVGGAILHANRTACEMIGVEPSEVSGKPLWETPWWAHSPAEREKLREGIRRAGGGELVRMETTHRAADGSVHDMDLTLRPAYDESGRPFCLIIEARDVTAAERVEENLRRNEAMLRGVFQATLVGITINVARVLTSVNESMCALTGYSEQELVGRSARMLYESDEEYGRVGRELYQRMPRGGRTSVETRLRRKDGTAIIVILTAAMVAPDDPSAGYVVTVQDLSEGKRAEEALRESEDRFRGVVEQSPFSIQVFAPNGDVQELNKAGEELWKVSSESLAGYNILRDAQIEKLGFMPVVRRAFTGEQARTPVVEYDAGNTVGTGIKKVVQGVFYPVRDAKGEIRQVILVHFDLTEQTRAEKEKGRLQEQLQQAMKMEAVGRLAGGIAHDFNNLLTTIAGNVELARMDPATARPVAHHLEEIARAAESAAALTRQLLAFSRRQVIEPRVLNLNDLVGGLKGMLARLLGEDVELRTALGDDLGSVRIDPGQLEQVLVNLAVNARDAMAKGGRLLIQTRNEDLNEEYCARHPQTLPGKYVLLIVSDSGHGMSDEVKKRVFEPFFTTKPQGKGTGLGLATTFGIVSQAGGAIDVYSEVGLGSTFRIHLPRVELPSERPAVEKRSMEVVGGRETVLLVEDNESVLAFARISLGRLGYTVLAAANAAEALRCAGQRHERIDLLMTDVVMPGMNGRELADRLLALHPETKVLYTSGYTQNVIVHHGVLEENLHFIGKPYSLLALSGKIRDILDPQSRPSC